MKRFIVIAILFLCLGFVSAHDVSYKEKFSESKYYPHERVVFSRTVLANYDNDDRHSTYDYRHGYSYRMTRDYFEENHKDVFSYDDNYRRRHYDERDDWDHHSRHGRDSYYGKKAYYYKYVPHLRNYEKRECYLSAPRGKLFYVKCP